MTTPPKVPAEIAAAIADYPETAREKFHQIRAIIFEAAASNPDVGPLTETLKWGEPAYVTEATRAGSTIRVAWKAKTPTKIGLFFNCQTSLVETMRSIYPQAFTFQGNRAVMSDLKKPLTFDPVEHCIRMAQTYHIPEGNR